MKAFFTFLLAFCILSTALYAQQPAAADAAKKDDSGWKIGGGLGLDLAGLGLINPRLGGGTNRLGLGGLINLTANNKRAKDFWDNSGVLQLSVQRIGGKSKPFQKSADIVRLGTRYGYNIIKDKLFFAADGTAESQLLPTYANNELSGKSTDLLSKFLSPLRVQVSPGIDYKPTSKMSFFFSPISLSLVYVQNDSLSALANHPLGNEAGKNTRTQLGYALKGQYADKFFKDKVAFSSKIAWFADYSNHLNGNVLWQNSVSLALFKGFSLDLFGDIFYDHFSQAIVKEVPANTASADLGPYLGLKPSYTGGFLLKYSRIF